MNKGMDMIFSLFYVTLAQEVPFSTYCNSAFLMDLYRMFPFIFADKKNVDLAVTYDGFL